jgi:hypothetical protein
VSVDTELACVPHFRDDLAAEMVTRTEAFAAVGVSE